MNINKSYKKVLRYAIKKDQDQGSIVPLLLQIIDKDKIIICEIKARENAKKVIFTMPKDINLYSCALIVTLREESQELKFGYSSGYNQIPCSTDFARKGEKITLIFN